MLKTPIVRPALNARVWHHGQVANYTAAFEGQIDEAGEAELARVSDLCCSSKGREIRQPLPSARPKEDPATLMQLMGLALQAVPKLQQLARDAVEGREGCEVVLPPKPTKGILRALQKAQEEYEGDYTRILDLARVSIICDRVTQVAAVLEWLLAPERKPRFEFVRTKDRLSRNWDAEMSGGNRDVMVNGWLDLGGKRRLVVELQLHVRTLYDLKSDLHVLYAGARVLGAMEEATTQHEGIVSDAVLEGVERGVVRQLCCPVTRMDTVQRKMLVDALQREPCALLELDLAFASLAPRMMARDGGGEGAAIQMVDDPQAQPPRAFAEWTVANVLEPETRTLACRRLRYLNLGVTGLCGDIPESLAQCVDMKHLDLGWNALSGSVPEWLGQMRSLRILKLSSNRLTGPIPAALGECGGRRLEQLHLFDNMLEGLVPSESLALQCALKELKLSTRPPEDRDSIPERDVAYMKALGIWYSDGGNPQLRVSISGQRAIEAAAMPECVFWWPATEESETVAAGGPK